MCVAYEDEDGKRYTHVPYHQSVLHKVKPVYETLPGWGTEIVAASRVEELPAAARDYVRFIEEFLRRAGELRRCRTGTRSDHRASRASP